MARRWTCRKCKALNQRTASRRCEMCGEATKPKTRVPKHAETLRDDSYDHYVEVNRELHGVIDESCGLCGKPRAQERRHDRDHDHKTGHPRGLLCVPCNKLLPHQVTVEYARLQLAYLERAAEYPIRFKEAA